MIIISRLIKLVGRNQKADFVQTILSDDHEVTVLKQCAGHMEEAVRLVVSELIGFTKVCSTVSIGWKVHRKSNDENL